MEIFLASVNIDRVSFEIRVEIMLSVRVERSLFCPTEEGKSRDILFKVYDTNLLINPCVQRFWTS